VRRIITKDIYGGTVNGQKSIGKNDEDVAGLDDDDGWMHGWMDGDGRKLNCGKFKKESFDWQCWRRWNEESAQSQHLLETFLVIKP